jgi:hypothetical protein
VPPGGKRLGKVQYMASRATATGFKSEKNSHRLNTNYFRHTGGLKWTRLPVRGRHPLPVERWALVSTPTRNNNWSSRTLKNSSQSDPQAVSAVFLGGKARQRHVVASRVGAGKAPALSHSSHAAGSINYISAFLTTRLEPGFPGSPANAVGAFAGGCDLN